MAYVNAQPWSGRRRRRLQRVEKSIKFAQGTSSSSVIGTSPQVSCECQTSFRQFGSEDTSALTWEHSASPTTRHSRLGKSHPSTKRLRGVFFLLAPPDTRVRERVPRRLAVFHDAFTTSKTVDRAAVTTPCPNQASTSTTIIKNGLKCRESCTDGARGPPPESIRLVQGK